MKISVFSPGAEWVVVDVHVDGDVDAVDVRRDGDRWVAEIADGSRYGLRAGGSSADGFDPNRTLVDPDASAVHFPDGHSRDAARPGAAPNHQVAPLAVAARWPDPRPQHRTSRPLIVHEVHVRGMTKRRDRPDAGTFTAMIDELPRLAELGVSVIELLPIHQFDPDENNYWGYMPLVFGAVHHRYAATDDAATELADLVTEAHRHDIEVWIDVVFNHTTEEDERGPTYNLRGLADEHHYAIRGDDAGARYVDDAGCGNIIDAHSPEAQRLIMTALDRFVDLGIDGFRFDLATVLARDPAFVRSIGDWAEQRGIRLVAEAWDIARYQVGRAWPDQRWMQWNDRFRDDMRGFLRGEPDLVGNVMQRIQGSPDLFDGPTLTVNFLTAHDGFTMYDLVAHDHKHNGENGWDGNDGPDENRSWNCGWEGDEGASDDVMTLRRRQLRNAWTLLMLSHGTPMFVAGDEFARTQGGNNNPYNQDNETTWTDWERRDDFVDLESFAARLIDFRAKHPSLTQAEWWGTQVEWFGATGPPDLAHHSRSLAWHVGGLYVMANMWWEPLDFQIQAPGPWAVAIDTSLETGFVASEPVASEPVCNTVAVGARSIVVLTT